MINKNKTKIIVLFLLISFLIGHLAVIKTEDYDNCKLKQEVHKLNNLEVLKNIEVNDMENKYYATSSSLGIGLRLFEIKTTNERNQEGYINYPQKWSYMDYNVLHSLYINAVYKYFKLDILDKQLDELNQFKEIKFCKLDRNLSGDVKEDVNRYLFLSKYMAINTWFSVEKLTEIEQSLLIDALSFSKSEREKNLEILVERTWKKTINSSYFKQYPSMNGNEHKIGTESYLQTADIEIAIYLQNPDISFSKYTLSEEIVFKYLDEFEKKYGMKASVKYYNQE